MENKQHFSLRIPQKILNFPTSVVISCLQQVQIVVNEIDTKLKELASSYRVSLEDCTCSWISFHMSIGSIGLFQWAYGVLFYVLKLVVRAQGQYCRGKTRADTSRRVQLKDHGAATWCTLLLFLKFVAN
jgi:hypothetical protein